MHRLGLGGGRPRRFASNGHLSMLPMHRFGRQAAGFVFAPVVRFPARKARTEQRVKGMRINALSQPFVRHLARHVLSFQSEGAGPHVGAQTHPLGCSFECGLPSHLGQAQHTKQNCQGERFPAPRLGSGTVCNALFKRLRAMSSLALAFSMLMRGGVQGEESRESFPCLWCFLTGPRTTLFFGFRSPMGEASSPLSLLLRFLEWENPGRFYHIGGFKGGRWYNKQLDTIRSKRDRCKKGSRRYKHLSQVYQRVSQQKRNKQHDSLHKASHLIAHTLVERTVVVGDLSQRQMVMKEHQERNKHLNRAVFNEWSLYTFIQMLLYECHLYGKDLQILEERDTSKTWSACGHKQAMPLWKRTYRCPNPECRFVVDRDENSAVNILKRYLARLGPHTGDPVRCADVFTAIEHQCAEVSNATDNVLNIFQHM